MFCIFLCTENILLAINLIKYKHKIKVLVDIKMKKRKESLIKEYSLSSPLDKDIDVF